MERTMRNFVLLFRLKTSLTTSTLEDQLAPMLTCFPDKPTELKSSFTAAIGMSSFHTLIQLRTLSLLLNLKSHTFINLGSLDLNMQDSINFTLDFCSWLSREPRIKYPNQREKQLSNFSKTLWMAIPNSNTYQNTLSLNSLKTNEWTVDQ